MSADPELTEMPQPPQVQVCFEKHFGWPVETASGAYPRNDPVMQH